MVIIYYEKVEKMIVKLLLFCSTSLYFILLDNNASISITYLAYDI